MRPLRPLWLEDIIKLDHIDTLAEFRRLRRMPVSASEMLLSAPEFAQVLEKRAAPAWERD